MTSDTESVPAESVAVLRRWAHSRLLQEQCELCSIPLPSMHRHLLETPTGRINCACDACALRFQTVVNGRFKLIPRQSRRLVDFEMSDDEWESLALPINLVFVFQSSRTNRLTALYPSPAGATESLLPAENWAAVVAKHQRAAQLQPDVEALLVHRLGEARDYFIAPIDLCFELAGIIRTHWRGFSGGPVVWQKIEEFFSRLKENSLDLKAKTVNTVYA